MKKGFAALVGLLLGYSSSAQEESPSQQPIFVGGWGDWKYVYEPSFFPLPAEATVEHAHGIAISPQDGNVVITYQDKVDDSKCLLQWNASGGYQQEPTFLGPGQSLCSGVPHGLQAATENNNNLVLYHANNQQSLHKTTWSGDILWSNQETPGKNNGTSSADYRPTWFAAVPGTDVVYMTDGYGSSNIYLFEKDAGTYTGQHFGGLGSEHGKFHTCHAITWDERFQQIVVCDRENHRLEYFHIDRQNTSVFDYSHTVSFAPLLKRPCNIRIRDDGMAIVPALEGVVGILNHENDLISVLNVTRVLGSRGFLHPHDAHFLPDDSGDFVLVTWNPGRIGYFRRVNQGEIIKETE